MKILHTADWHLGKRLDSFSRIDEQVLVMDEIVHIADRENVDLVIIAGDLFDAFNPGVEAIELFYRTIKRLTKNGMRPVIAIAGNHDSPHLIDAPDPLARASGIILIGHPHAVVTPFATEGFTVLQSDTGFIELSL
ncbi:MAG TPA: exonuclease sbcCD subunit D, partial [Sphingobacterium sp.]|nr:exonuclease sbcCD subunit D [Sphingobacterium sp.]